MKTLIITIFFPNFVLYFSSSRFEIIKLGKIVDPKMNFKKMY